MPRRKNTVTSTNRPAIETVLIEYLIKERNPGVDFTLQIGPNGIEEVLVNGSPQNVDFKGVLSPRVEGKPHWKFYALTDECLKQDSVSARNSSTPPPPVLDHFLLQEAIRLKNPGKPISSYGFSRGKVTDVRTKKRQYTISKTGTLY